ncbi:DUF1127 domain-containing protein [Loktanella sp. Alg231-35]|uniref:DUF1127 domain-containing protein n=1 Tax=Loktanella sp. Alg231-35 TaxID=1922220 RepID=UPI00131F0E70|nr:DUF1127 domain-containing protein [Loktanella sp. Alg231-35]
MTASPNTTGPEGHHIATSALTQNAPVFLEALARFGGNAMAKAKSVLRAVQMARMLSTLSKMSDAQLAMIGIQRSDIPQYAKTLMAED